MAQEGQRSSLALGEVADVVTFDMPAGSVFDWHTHRDHQLAWAPTGVLSVRTAAAGYVLPPTRALFIPAGTRHETLSDGNATMRSVYLRPALCSVNWPDCTPVAVTALLAEVIGYLAEPSLEATHRGHGETLLVDLLQPVTMTAIEVRMPVDERAKDVADRLSIDPADDRSLAEWGREVGASGRTLARAFLADTGLPFGRWRTLLRIRAAVVDLANGEAISNTARRVGYESTSAFVAAFRRETGATPATYFPRQHGGT